jgi:taurine dioxygenase
LEAELTCEQKVIRWRQDPEHPEIMFLSNIVENGKPIGLADAGQGWHTDLSYNRVIALANVLHAIKVPRDQSGRPLGRTQFVAMHAAYDDLSAEMKARLKNATAAHDFNKFWEMMRRDKGSKRPPLTPQQRASKPPVSHPIFLTHPITGRKVLYANPGYTVPINDMDAAESDETVLLVRPPTAAEVLRRASLERRRPDDVEQYRHAARCRRGLRTTAAVQAPSKSPEQERGN